MHLGDRGFPLGSVEPGNGFGESWGSMGPQDLLRIPGFGSA